jgi:hypothetical protein
MLIEAVIDKGQVRFLQPIQFVHDYFLVKIEIPESEIAAKQVVLIEAAAQADEVSELKKLTSTLFGNGYRYVPEKTDKEILIEELTKKYA